VSNYTIDLTSASRCSAAAGHRGRWADTVSLLNSQYWKKDGVEDTNAFEGVRRLVERLRQHLDGAETQRLIRERHVLGASSAGIQEVILMSATQLGFQDEKRGLFACYQVPALRQDYFRAVDATGILLEVERKDDNE